MNLTARLLLILAAAAGASFAQEAVSGIDLRATVTAQAMYAGSEVSPGLHSLLYPTIKLNDQWSLSGVFQVISRPWDRDEARQGYGIRGRLLQLNLSWAHSWNRGSVVIRAGEMLSAFGSFPLRYDDMDNPLTGLPVTYGYYAPVSLLGLAGMQADVTLGKWDARAQLVNSSPANPRSIFAHDQYANWAGGFGYTVRQGIRVGTSAYRGPYLDRKGRFYSPGEASPRDLPATAVGMDAEWAQGHWNVRGELQHFLLPYVARPNIREAAGYIEVRRVLNPRWFLAARAGYWHTTFAFGANQFEAAGGFRPNSRQLVKVGYIVSAAEGIWQLDRTAVIQLVSAVHFPSLAFR
jgi:hypothetical protein